MAGEEEKKRLEQYRGLRHEGRHRGELDKLPALEPIHVNAMPYRVKKVKAQQTPAEYMEEQSPAVLQYMFKRMNAFMVYADKGIHDPLGYKIFKCLSSEIAKSAGQAMRTAQRKGEAGGLGNEQDGYAIKAYRKKLVSMKQSLSGQSESINSNAVEEGNYSVIEDDDPLLSDMEDEF